MGSLSKTKELLDGAKPASDLTAEAGVLGSVLLLPDVLDDVALILAPADFYDANNSTLFARLLAMRSAGKRIDMTLLRSALEKHGELEAIGGIARLATLSQSVPHAAYARQYAEIVRDLGAKRALVHVGSEIVQIAFNQSLDAREAVAAAESKLFAVRDDRLIGASHTSDIGIVLMAAMDAIESRRLDSRPSGQPTGFHDLDGVTTMRPGELTILAARTSMGKTALALNIARNVAETLPVVFFSLEMTAMALADRMLSSESGVNLHWMTNGTINTDHRQQLAEASGVLAQLSLDVDDSGDLDVTELSSIARRLKRTRKGLGLIVVDYLQLMRPEDSRAPREQQVSRTVARLKGIARELNCPLLCLAQLNRQAETAAGNRPRLSHLRESGAIEQDADVVLFVHREEYYINDEAKKDALRGQAEVIVAKNRNGPTATVPLCWQKEYTRFVSAAQRPFNDGKTKSSEREPAFDAWK